MLILDAVTKSLKIVLAGAVATTQLPVTAHYTDITTTAYTPGSNDTVTNSTTAVEFVAAPAASTQRHVESISVYNVDTASATVTIQYVSAGGTRQVIKVVLLTLETLVYEDGTGWQAIDANGNLKTSFPGMAPAGTAESDFIVAGTSPFAWIKKTLVEAKALLGLVITAGKTITCTQDTSLDEAVAMSSKAPKSGAALTSASVNTINMARNAAAGISGSGGTLTATLANAVTTNTGALVFISGFQTGVAAFTSLHGWRSYDGAVDDIKALPANLVLTCTDNLNFVLTNTTGNTVTASIVVIT